MLYIIVRQYFMADFILRAFEGREDVRILAYKRRRGVLNGICKFLRLRLFNRRGVLTRALLPGDIAHALHAAAPDDVVMLWGIENRKETEVLAGETACRHLVSFLWNPMLRLRRKAGAAARYRAAMKACGVRLLTFDKTDSRLLGCACVPQVHRRAALPPAEGRGAFFVGYDKGREPLLKLIADALATAGVPCHINILRRREHSEAPRAFDSGCYLSQPLAYDTVLQRIAASACLIDIVQPGQTGITLRTLEALFYRKKLITNNPEVLKQDFYRPANIHYIDASTDADALASALARFLATPFESVPEHIVQQYEIQHWLPSVCSENSELHSE